MENVGEILEAFSEFRSFCEVRGYELIKANGSKLRIYDFSDKFEVESDGVSIIFRENTNYDCPDSETIYLSISELEMNETDWEIYINNIITKTKLKEEEKLKQIENDKFLRKQTEYLKLRKELGYEK